MPARLQRPCSPTCPTLVERGRCALHRANTPGPRPHYRLYHLARWVHPVKGLRARTLRRFPLCVACLKHNRITASREVDHIVPHHGNATLFWNEQNVTGLCRACHCEKTWRGR
jgi:5-methylcytosine-specific restriction enzyme A